MRVLLALLALLLATPAWAQTVTWFDGAENGDALGFGLFGGSGTCLGSTTAIKTGAYSMACSSSGGASRRVFPGPLTGTTAYARFYFRWASPFAATQSMAFFGNAALTHFIYLCHRQSDNKIFWQYDGTCNAAVAVSTTAMTVDTWYLIEVKAVIHASAGGVELKINGSTEFTSLATNTSSMADFSTMIFGGNFGVGNFTFYYDDAMLCTGAYCPSGKTIARQGTSGSPTYTSWTPNSCTSNLIENCWSQTPVNTTPNASSATASAAQTMIVASFGSTQTGHGSETIGNTSTINACKTVMIAKSGTASAPIAIRRRIASADTDSASKSLTTSDAYYDDGSIWTTTADILRNQTVEIGVVHGTGTATDTVEDMWLTCDYLDSTVPTRRRSRIY